MSQQNPLTWEKNVVLETGVTVGFWAVRSLRIDLETLHVYADCDGYLNSDAYAANWPRILLRSYAVDFSTYQSAPQIISDIVAKVQAVQ